jgi:hypothetical protein
VSSEMSGRWPVAVAGPVAAGRMGCGTTSVRSLWGGVAGVGGASGQALMAAVAENTGVLFGADVVSDATRLTWSPTPRRLTGLRRPFASPGSPSGDRHRLPPAHSAKDLGRIRPQLCRYLDNTLWCWGVTTSARWGTAPTSPVVPVQIGVEGNGPMSPLADTTRVRCGWTAPCGVGGTTIPGNWGSAAPSTGRRRPGWVPEPVGPRSPSACRMPARSRRTGRCGVGGTTTTASSGTAPPRGGCSRCRWRPPGCPGPAGCSSPRG